MSYPAEIVRRKVEADLELGYSREELARLYGIHRDTLLALTKGTTDRVINSTALKVLNLSLLPGQSGEVPALGTRRRLRSLVADGHTASELTRWLIEHGYEVGPVWVKRIVATDQHKHVMADRARGVEALFEALCMCPGTSLHNVRQSAAKGWPRPLAWDEEMIDSPRARPRVPKTRRAV